MREVRLTQKEHERFIKAMEAKMEEYGINIDDLSKALNVSIQSLYNFRADRSRKPSRFLGGKIATYLDMTPKDWR